MLTPPTGELVSSAISGIAFPILKSVIEGSSNFWGKFRNKLKDKEAEKQLLLACQEYESSYRGRHCFIRVLRMRKPTQLELIYTESFFLDPRTEYSAYSYHSREELEKKFEELIKHEQERKDHPIKLGIKVANNTQKLMVLGEAGSGKSTFLRMIGLEALKREKGKYKYECIPVFIELKHLGAEKFPNLEKNITNEFSICGFPEPELFTSELLKKGKLLILLDGLDEVPERNLNRLLIEIKNFTDRYNRNRFVASCRTAAKYSSFINFTDFVIPPFSNAAIETFINKWFCQELDIQAGTAQKCWELLQEQDNSAARELAQNPLMLTLLCLVYETSQNFPNNRASLYEDALNVFLKDWLVQKRVERDPIYKDLDTALDKTMLSEIAYEGFTQEGIYFDKYQLVNKIENFFQGNIRCPENLKKMPGEKVLRAIEVQQGVLVERSQNLYAFSHLTFQEYLTAYYVYTHNKIRWLATSHFTKTYWKEVFLLVAGLMSGGADSLLLLIEKEAWKLINTPKLQGLIQWVNVSTDGWKGDFNPIAVRAVVLAIVGSLAEARINDSHLKQLPNIEKLRINAFTYAYALAFHLDKRIVSYLNYIHIIVSAAASFRALENYRERVNKLQKIFKKLKVFKQLKFVCLKNNLEDLKSKIPNKTQPDTVRREFANNIWKTWLRAFNLSSELISLSKQEAENLHNYLFANLLIVKCQEAAMRVSPTTWRELEMRMLRISPSRQTPPDCGKS